MKPSAWARYAAILLTGGAAGAMAGQGAPPPILFRVDRFVVSGENPLAAGVTEATLAPFIGPQEGLSGLIEAAAALNAELREAGFPFHRAILPPQTVADGSIRLEVITARIKSVSITGNEHFDAANVRRTAPGLTEGETPPMQRLSRALALANQHPARQVTLTFSEGEQPGEVGATLDVRDQRPWALFSSINNVGTPQPGRSRLTLGGQHSNLWNRDHIFTASYTTTPESVEDVEQIGLNYRIPLYAWASTVTLSHVRSTVDTGPVLGGDIGVFTVSGAGRFNSVLVSHFLPNVGAYRQAVNLGLEDKLFLSDVFGPGGIEQIGDVRARPLSLRYDGGFRAPRWNFGFGLSYTRNLLSGELNDDLAYAQSRSLTNRGGEPGVPRAAWDALRLTANAALALPKNLEARLIFEGQWTDQPLIAGERFGIGGFASVRGYEERAVTGDRGARLSFELYAPPLPYDVRALWFIDAGHVAQAVTLRDEIGAETLVSTGIGARWAWNNRFSLLFDAGHELKGAKGTSAGGHKAHVTANYRY